MNSPGFSQLVVFVVERQRYALALAEVERALPMAAATPLPAAPPIVTGVLSLHGTPLPVVDLRRRLELVPRAPRPEDHLLVVHTPRRTLALCVDEVQGVLEVPAERITASTAVVPGIGQVAGIVALPDGLLLVHDLDALLSLDEDRQLGAALQSAGA